MGKISTWYDDKITGKPPKGCELCALGSKVVLFITGDCPYNCYYCPLSEDRQKDVIFANEQAISSIDDIIAETRAIDGLGVGITGGEPTLQLDRVIKYIKDLKNEFGEKFHIHLYTARAVPKDELEKLHESGLDEIRFHSPRLVLTEKMKEAIKMASRLDWSVGTEIPSIPEKMEELKEIITFAIAEGLEFINLNELEFTETNFEGLNEEGYESISSTNPAAKGSKKIALRLLKEYKNATTVLHFCSSRYKDRVQLRNRFLRRAQNYRTPYDQITDEGLIVRGRIIVKDEKFLVLISAFLEDYCENHPELVEINKEKSTIFIEYFIAKTVAPYLIEQFPKMIEQIAIIHQYPMDNGFIAYLDPIYEDSNYSSRTG